MAVQMRVPSNVSSITFSTSGVIAPVNNIVSGITNAELQSCVVNSEVNSRVVSTNLSNGTVSVQFPLVITSITINGNVITPNASGIASGINATDATAYLGATFHTPFELVTGA